ncbi:MAG: YidH family protein [Desulfomonilaceae bacterium]
MSLLDKVKAQPNNQKMESKPPAVMDDDRIFLAWQRTHMANERTFLSWSRTSISLLAFGFVIEKFEIFMRHLVAFEEGAITQNHSNSAMYLSLLCFILAGFMIVVSGIRFILARRHINKGEAVFSAVPDLLVVVSVAVIIGLALILGLQRYIW